VSRNNHLLKPHCVLHSTNELGAVKMLTASSVPVASPLLPRHM